MEDNRLIDGIISRAEEEAAGIIAEAEKSAASRDMMYEANLKQLRKETDQKIAERLADIERRTVSAVQSEKRRQFLRSMESLNHEIDRIFHIRIAEMIDKPGYDDFLAKLIAEGALAVDDEEVSVSCSFKEKITQQILEKADSLVREISGRRIKMKLSDGPPLAKQGIIVRSSNGRISYNNQIDARLRRFSEDIKMIITKGLRKE